MRNQMHHKQKNDFFFFIILLLIIMNSSIIAEAFSRALKGQTKPQYTRYEIDRMMYDVNNQYKYAIKDALYKATMMLYDGYNTDEISDYKRSAYDEAYDNWTDTMDYLKDCEIKD